MCVYSCLLVFVVYCAWWVGLRFLVGLSCWVGSWCCWVDWCRWICVLVVCLVACLAFVGCCFFLDFGCLITKFGYFAVWGLGILWCFVWFCICWFLLIGDLLSLVLLFGCVNVGLGVIRRNLLGFTGLRNFLVYGVCVLVFWLFERYDWFVKVVCRFCVSCELDIGLYKTEFWLVLGLIGFFG